VYFSLIVGKSVRFVLCAWGEGLENGYVILHKHHAGQALRKIQEILYLVSHA
jgi:hypothetical protein